MDKVRRVYKSVSDLEAKDVRTLYDGFDSPIARLDCGRKCAPHNPSGKPFCCDICHAVPAAYTSEWKYLQGNTQLWHAWRGDECGDTNKEERACLKADTPKQMILLACLGPSRCEREFRALSCRQFPFFPYVSSDYRFLGLAYEWGFESKCWVISNLSSVTQQYRDEFVRTYDRLLALFQDEFDNYVYHSEKLRAEFLRRKKRFPLLHRNGENYLVSPGRERLQRIDAAQLPNFAPYSNSDSAHKAFA
jgi:hypothetical protein